MEDVLKDIIDAHPGCAERGLMSCKYQIPDLLDVEQRLLDTGVCSLYAPMRTLEGYAVNALSLGRGPIKVLAWSQMHGNEPVSTLSLIDALWFLCGDSCLARAILENVTILAIPLLNPEGHVRHNRRNSQGIDVNRDAKNLVSPEAEFLMEMHSRFCPDYGLNLHDQEVHHVTSPDLLVTLVALLAPECDVMKTVTPARRRAMEVAGYVASVLSGCDVAFHRLAKYQDSFTPTAFGDTFMQKGTSSVLIEAGTVPRDTDRKTARRMVFASILLALQAMQPNVSGSANYYNFYEALPINEYGMAFDLKICGLEVACGEKRYRVDVGIRRVKPSLNDEDFADSFSDFRIVNIGNLDAFGALEFFDAHGYRLAGEYTGLYVGRHADFAILDNGGVSIDVKTLLKNI